MWLSLAHQKRTGGPFSTHAQKTIGSDDKDVEMGAHDDDVLGATAPITPRQYDGTSEVRGGHAHNVSDESAMTVGSGPRYDPTYQAVDKEGGATQPYPGT